MNRLILKTALFEGVLRIYKTQLWHEMKLQQLEKLSKLQPETAKQKREIEKNIKSVQKDFNDRIKRAEKYNSEVLNECDNIKHLETFIDTSIDLYSDVTDTILNVLSDTNSTKKLHAAILEESEDGSLFHKGKRYKIHD